MLKLWKDILIVLVFLGMAACLISLGGHDKPDREYWEEVPDHEVFGGTRSSHWPSVRAKFVKAHPRCEACGVAKGLNVHHIRPYQSNPELELDPTNLITLCREHHLSIGHLGNWHRANPNVSRDAEILFKKLQHEKAIAK
jgi:5-methylcytosine-specific restriction enzyme A